MWRRWRRGSQNCDFRFSVRAHHGVLLPHLHLLGGVVGGCFLTTASHGTDQLMVQRLLSARNERQSRAGAAGKLGRDFLPIHACSCSSACCSSCTTAIATGPPRAHLDRIYPEFIWNNLPPGVAGPGDCRHPGCRHGESERRAEFAGLHHDGGFLSRPRAAPNRREPVAAAGRAWPPSSGARCWWSSAMPRGHSRSVLEAGLSIASVPSGALLGVFLLGVLPASRARTRPWPAWWPVWPRFLRVFPDPVAFTWYVLIGTTVTFTVGLAASCLRNAIRMRMQSSQHRTEARPGALGPPSHRRRHRHRQRHFPGAARHGARVGTPGMVFVGVDLRRPALSGRRSQLRRAGGRHAGGRRRICLPARSLRTSLGIPV